MVHFERLIAQQALEVARANTGIKISDSHPRVDGFSSADISAEVCQPGAVITVLDIRGEWVRLEEGESLQSTRLLRGIYPAVIAGAVMAIASTGNHRLTVDGWEWEGNISRTLHVFKYGDVIDRIKAAQTAANRKAIEAFPLAQNGTRRRIRRPQAA